MAVTDVVAFSRKTATALKKLGRAMIETVNA
jgi:hypothetical protein